MLLLLMPLFSTSDVTDDMRRDVYFQTQHNAVRYHYTLRTTRLLRCQWHGGQWGLVPVSTD